MAKNLPRNGKGCVEGSLIGGYGGWSVVGGGLGGYGRLSFQNEHLATLLLLTYSDDLFEL